MPRYLIDIDANGRRAVAWIEAATAFLALAIAMRAAPGAMVSVRCRG